MSGLYYRQPAVAYILQQGRGLPALPKAWKNGHMKGIRVVGNASVDIEWKDSELVSAKLSAFSDIDTTVKIIAGIHKGEKNVHCCAGGTIELI